jgi:tetratricopeptide (TPR) repeat protein
MKKTLLTVMLILVAAAGCDQQRQQPQGQAPYPGGVMMRTPEEINRLQQLADQAPRNPQAWTLLGDALMDSNRFAEAVDAYQKSLALDPKNVNARVDMGTCLKNSGRPQQAIEEYKKAIKIEPGHLNAHRNMGVVLAFDLNDRKGAVKAFEKYLELAPNAPDAGEIRQLIQNLKAGT